MTDTEKWRDPWMMKLPPPKAKYLWPYLCDVCDFAGIWKENYELASVEFGQPFTWEEIQTFFGDRVIRISPTRIFIPGVIRFLYGKKFPTESSMHKSVVKRLEEFEINPKTLRPASPYLSTDPSRLIHNDTECSQGGPTLIKTKKEKNINIEIEKKGECEGETSGPCLPPPDVAAIWSRKSSLVRGMP